MSRSTGWHGEPELMHSSSFMCSLLLASLVPVAIAQHECNTGVCRPLLQALDALEASGSDTQLQQACMAGMARVLLHLGDLRGGKTLAQQLNSGSLWKECAGILEQMHQHQEAAEMYEAAGMSEKAAAIFIAARNWAAAAPLMARVTSAKLQLQYAKAKESDGSYAEAVAAYEAAGAFAKHMLVLVQLQCPVVHASQPCWMLLCIPQVTLTQPSGCAWRGWVPWAGQLPWRASPAAPLLLHWWRELR